MLPFPLKLFSAIRFITIVLFDKQRFRYVSNPILFLKWVIHIWRVQCYGCLHGSLSISMRVCKCVCRNLFFGYYINFHCGWIIIIIKLDCESNIIDGFCEQKSKQIRAFVCTQTAFRFYFHRICFFVTTVGWMPFLFVSFNSMSSNEYVRIFFTKPLTPHRIKSRSLNRIKSRRRAPTTETRSSRLFSKKKCCAYLDFVALIFCLGGSLKPLYFPSLVRFLQSQGCFAGVETEYMAQMKQKDGKHFFILNRRNNRMNKQKKNPSPLEPAFFLHILPLWYPTIGVNWIVCIQLKTICTDRSPLVQRACVHHQQAELRVLLESFASMLLLLLALMVIEPYCSTSIFRTWWFNLINTTRSKINVCLSILVYLIFCSIHSDCELLILFQIRGNLHR